jgi:hypothetical protein
MPRWAEKVSSFSEPPEKHPGRMLKEMGQFWLEDKGTIQEASYWQNAGGSQKVLFQTIEWENFMPAI